MVLATRVSTNTGHGGDPKLHPSVLSGRKYCGFFQSRILHYFPLSVRVCVCTVGCFSKDTLKENPTQYATGGDLGRIYPEGEGDRTSLGGRQRHLKFGKKSKIRGGVNSKIGNIVVHIEGVMMSPA